MKILLIIVSLVLMVACETSGNVPSITPTPITSVSFEKLLRERANNADRYDDKYLGKRVSTQWYS